MPTTFDCGGRSNIPPGTPTMRKLLLASMAVATLAAGALTTDRAEATPLAAAAGARTATEGAGPIEQVAYRWPHHHRHHYGYGNRYRHGYVPYRYPSRYNSPHGGFHYR
jgi:hypothetical protein